MEAGYRKLDTLFGRGRILATLLPAVMWKIENPTNKFVDLAKQISGQNVESAIWFLSAVYGKVLRERWTKMLS